VSTFLIAGIRQKANRKPKIVEVLHTPNGMSGLEPRTERVSVDQQSTGDWNGARL
jgi:hypothetical protein